MARTYPSENKPFSVRTLSENQWELFRKGNRDALGQIYRSHVDDLYHYGMHFCHDNEKVKDCLQDLFRDLWLDREQLAKQVRSVRYYLLSSLRRRLLRSLQADRRHLMEPLPDTYDFELIPPHEKDIIDNEAYNEQVAQLHRGIASLSRRQREAIYLRFFQNLSYAEIAELMSMKVDSVYNLISKALGLLKKSFPLFIILLLLKR